MKRNAASILTLLTFALCSVFMVSCDEKESHDNFGPSVFEDNGPKSINASLRLNNVPVKELSMVNKQVIVRKTGNIIANSFLLGATGLNAEGEGIAITVPNQYIPGTYPIDTLSIVQVRYFTKDRTYVTDSGFIQITVNDTINNRMAGTFNLRTSRNTGYKANGSFDIDFQ